MQHRNEYSIENFFDPYFLLQNSSQEEVNKSASLRLHSLPSPSSSCYQYHQDRLTDDDYQQEPDDDHQHHQQDPNGAHPALAEHHTLSSSLSS